MKRSGVAWLLYELYLMTCRPSLYVDRVSTQYERRSERLRYMLQFAFIPALLVALLCIATGWFCYLLHIQFDIYRTIVSVSVGVVAALTFGLALGSFYGVFYGFAFGMPAGVVISFPLAVWLTIPIEHKNTLTHALVSPPRAVIVGAVTGLIGGFLAQTNVALIGRTTRAIGVSLGLGALYWLSVSIWIDVNLGVFGGVVVGLLFAVGFTQRRQLLGNIIVGAGYGAVFGIGAGALRPELIAWKPVVFACSAIAYWLSCFRIVWYPFYMIAAVILYSRASLKPSREVKLWSYFPLNIDETLALRLPFTTEFLVLLGRTDPAFARNEALRIIADRPTHKPDAIDALTELIYSDLQADTMGGIIDVAERVAWIDRVLEPFEGRERTLHTLGQFRAISLECNGYHQLKSKNLRVRAKLDEIRKATSDLRDSLSYSEQPDSSRFLRIANAWSAVLAREHEEVFAEEDAYSSQIQNPFKFGLALTEQDQSVFVGRTQTAVFVERSLLDQPKQTLLFYGPRRTGKTSFLYQLPRLISGRIVRILVNAEAPAVRESRSSHLRYIVAQVERALTERGLLRESLLTPIIERRRKPQAEMSFELFEDWQQELESRLPADIHLLLCIDEYELLERTVDAGWGREIFALYRHLAQNSRFVLMFTGANTIGELGKVWAEHFPYVRPIRMSFLNADDVAALLTSPRPDFPVRYAPGTIAEIIRQTRCQPYLVQAVARILIDLLNEQSRLDITRDDVDEAIRQTFEQGEVYFSIFWNAAGSEGQSILRSAVSGQPIPTESAAMDWLVRNEVLTPDGAFVIPMFETWMRTTGTRL